MAQKPEDENPNFIVSRKVPPAFAGVLVDWKIGSREITATLIDLIVRNFLHIQNEQIFKINKTFGLREFEQKFISELFGQKNHVDFLEIEKIAYKNKYEILLKIICVGMIEEGFVDKGFQKKIAQATKKAVKETFGESADIHIPSNVKIIQLPSWIGKILVTLLGMKPTMDSIKQKTEQNLGETFEESMLTNLGKQQKQEALNLKKFMKTYPILEERLSNELAGHAIAFGIGKGWLKKFGGKNASLAQWIEKIESSDDTIARFIDMNAYFKEFQE